MMCDIRFFEHTMDLLKVFAMGVEAGQVVQQQTLQSLLAVGNFGIYKRSHPMRILTPLRGCQQMRVEEKAMRLTV